jgi:hypothetical protein
VEAERRRDAGVTRGTQALREAIERLNKLTLNDLTLDIEAQDEALAVTLGDVVTGDRERGLSARPGPRAGTPQIESRWGGRLLVRGLRPGGLFGQRRRPRPSDRRHDAAQPDRAHAADRRS